MMTTHNIHGLLNVDIGGGFPALIAEMLVQSSRGSVALLPALPADGRPGPSRTCTAGAVVLSELRLDPDSLQVLLSSPVAQLLSVRLPWPGRTSEQREPVTVVGSSWVRALRSCSGCRKPDDTPVHDDDVPSTHPVVPRFGP